MQRGGAAGGKLMVCEVAATDAASGGGEQHAGVHAAAGDAADAAVERVDSESCAEGDLLPTLGVERARMARSWPSERLGTSVTELTAATMRESICGLTVSQSAADVATEDDDIGDERAGPARLACA